MNSRARVHGNEWPGPAPGLPCAANPDPDGSARANADVRPALDSRLKPYPSSVPLKTAVPAGGVVCDDRAQGLNRPVSRRARTDTPLNVVE